MSFHARWSARERCPECLERILAGEFVEYVDDVLQHVSCDPVDEVARPTCNECFTIVAVNGACSCL